MTKREITAKSNAELIMQLAKVQTSTRVFKYEIEDANKIAAELAKRGVIENQDELMKPWLKFYTR